MTRLRRRKGTMDYLHEQDHVVMEPQSMRGRWHEVFGNDRPIHVELGMGKGRFIVEMSRLYPEINFIGIDMYDELIRKAAEKSEAPNLRFALVNIERIEEVFAENEITQIYLNFSDPWPKGRHARRRLTHPGFLEKYRGFLRPDSELHFKTDSRSLFEFSLNSFAELRLPMRQIRLHLHEEGTPEGHVFTEYEHKFVQQGMPIYRCEVLMRGESFVQANASLQANDDVQADED